MKEYITDIKKIKSYKVDQSGAVVDVEYWEDDINKSIQYCSEVLSKKYDLPIDRAKEMVMKSHYPSLLMEDHNYCEHISFNKWSKEIYELSEALENV